MRTLFLALLVLMAGCEPSSPLILLAKEITLGEALTLAKGDWWMANSYAPGCYVVKGHYSLYCCPASQLKDIKRQVWR